MYFRRALYPPRMCDVVCLSVCPVCVVSNHTNVHKVKEQTKQITCKRGRGRETVTESETRAQPHAQGEVQARVSQNVTF